MQFKRLIEEVVIDFRQFDVTSVGMAVAALPKSRAACSSLSVDRAATTTRAPASARARAVARPIPDEAPVTTATFPETDPSIIRARISSGGRRMVDPHLSSSAAGLVDGVGCFTVDVVLGDDREAGLDLGRNLPPSRAVTAASTPYCPIIAGCCATRA